MKAIRTLGLALIAASLAATTATQAQSALTEAQARAAIAPFYSALNAAPGRDAAALVQQAAGPGWLSCGSKEDCKPAADVGKAIAGFVQRVPDLKWEIKEVIVKGNRVIVRGEGSGTPSGDFMGVPHSGKNFTVLSIDIHTVENGKMVGKTYHVEDWMGATRQLSAK